jgi:hypothetical protein
MPRRTKSTNCPPGSDLCGVGRPRGVGGSQTPFAATVGKKPPTSHRWASVKRRIIALAGCAVLGLGACGAPASETKAVAAGAQAFETAVMNGRGAEACARLAPGTADEVAKSSGSPCARSILSVRLRGGEVSSVAVYGLQAEVVLSTDTVFLSRFEDGWRVIAAACTPQQGKPFDCLVKGS